MYKIPALVSLELRF